MRRFLNAQPVKYAAVMIIGVFFGLAAISYAQTTPTTTTPTVPPVPDSIHAFGADVATTAEGLSHVDYVTESHNAHDNDVKSVQVDCPNGEKVLGGGDRVAKHIDENMDSHPTAGFDGWVVHYEGSSTEEHVTVWAICAKVGSISSHEQ